MYAHGLFYYKLSSLLTDILPKNLVESVYYSFLKTTLTRYI